MRIMILRRLSHALPIVAAALITIPSSNAAGPPPPAVGVMVARKQAVYRDYTYVGRVMSPRIVNIQARVTGFLDKRLFHQGSYVTEGELLYVIEQAPYQAALDQAKANVASAKAALVEARVTLVRAQKLLHTPAGQQSSVDQAQATADGDAAALASTEAALESAEINFGYTEIHAPISGRIGATNVNVGNVVGPTNGVLATIVSEDPMRVVFSAPLSDLNALRASLAQRGGLAALALGIRLPGGRIDKQQGRIDFVNNEVSQTTDTLEIRGSIPNPVSPDANHGRAGDRTLASGESVTVLLRARAPSENIVLPRDAVLSDQLGDYVLAVGPRNVVVRRNVALGETTPATAAVASGIAPGDRIIVDGIEKVHPGVTVDPQVVKSTTAQG